MEKENPLKAQRREKLETLRSQGVNPYVTRFKPDAKASDITEQYGETSKEELEEKQVSAVVAGRIMAKRDFGKAAFLQVRDETGLVQVYIQKAKLGDELFELYQMMDIADFVGVEGTLFRTKTDELTLKATNIQLLTKSMETLPEKFHGLTDVETRYRQRYVDLIMNPDVRDSFRKRARIIQEIRNFFLERDYLEVETPMLHPIAGGAVARPFITHHNTYHSDLFMRIAPELYLKRLVVGGYEKVFEVNRNFRNEGVSPRHNPEFTMLEFYEAYATYEDLMDMTEELIRRISCQVLGSEQIKYQDYDLDFSKPFARTTIGDLILQYTDYTQDQIEDRELLTNALKKMGVAVLDSYGLGKLQFLLFEETVEEKLIQPTFVIQHPTEVSPLSKRNEENPDVVDRFELYIAGREIANGFNELNDPEDQKGRFEDQLKDREAGDNEAHMMDEDYITALEYGLPPTAGEGIGIDRLVMLFTNAASIRDVILFPLLKPQAKNQEETTTAE